MKSVITGKNRSALYAAAAILAALVVFAGTRSGASTMIEHASEDVMFAVAPSAERAYEYGSAHFDALHPDRYDIERAAEFFEAANGLDPSYPYVQHQRARIAFLNGDFEHAHALIDLEMARNPNPSSLYTRGLIRGFAGDFDGAAADYETFLRQQPTSWAGINDYAWVLLKADRPLDALVAIDWGLLASPDNAWLLNNKATAHFELGQYELAREAALNARDAIVGLSEEDWLRAYPGNDPLTAAHGVQTLRDAIDANIHSISLAIETPEGDVR